MDKFGFRGDDCGWRVRRVGLTGRGLPFRVGLLMLVAVVVAACSSTAPRTPDKSQSPAGDDPREHVVTALANGSCFTRGLPESRRPYRDSPLTVPAHPSGLLLLWVPSSQDRPCVQRRTTATAAQAQALAVDVNTAAPAIPADAVYYCPRDDGTQVLAYFLQNGGSATLITVALTGCRFITSASAGPRKASRQLRQMLSQLAPEAGTWRSRLS